MLLKNNFLNIMNKSFIAAIAVCFASVVMANAQVAIKTDAGDFKLTFKGRTHFDAGVYSGDLGKTNDHATNKISMNDTRLGVIASYDEKWSSKIEVRFSNSKATFTDLFVGYKFSDNSSLQVGNYWMPFGYKILGPAYRFIQNSSIDEAVNANSRRMGVMYTYNSDIFRLQAGVFSDGDVNNAGENQGYNISAKAIVRPILEENRVLHFGVAPLFTHTPITTNFDTKSLTQGKRITLLPKSFASDEQYNMFRGEVEAIFISGKFYAEGRYQHAQINTPNVRRVVEKVEAEEVETFLPNENEKIGGFFVQAGFLLIGDHQNYNKSNAYATNLSPKNLELIARFGNVSYNRGKDWGTSQNDITVGLNYAFNKYLLARINYAHGQSHAENSDYDKVLEKSNYNSVEARLQFVF